MFHQYGTNISNPNARTGNAIQVLNVNREQIGHIPRVQAAKLAPFMDRRSLIVEATISGHKEYYECPLTLHIYGPNDSDTRQHLIEGMRKAGLPVSSFSNAAQQQKEERERQKIAAQAAKRAKKHGATILGVGSGHHYETGLAEFAAGSSQSNGTGPSLEDIIGGSERFNPRNAEQFIEEFGIKESDLVSCFFFYNHSPLIEEGRNAKGNSTQSAFHRAA